MTLKLTNEYNFTANVTVQIPNGDKYQENKFKVDFKYNKKYLKDIANSDDSISDDDIVEKFKEVVFGWSDITDENGKEFEFNDNNLEVLMTDPFIGRAIAQAFYSSVAGVKLGN